MRDFVTLAFERAGLDWERHVRFDERYLRPSEVDSLIGDAAKAKKVLDWEPQTLTPDLVRIMVDADVALLEAELSGEAARRAARVSP